MSQNLNLPKPTQLAQIDWDERYPDFTVITDPNGFSGSNFTYEIEQETLLRWKTAIDAYNEVQNEIEEFKDNMKPID